MNEHSTNSDANSSNLNPQGFIFAWHRKFRDVGKQLNRIEFQAIHAISTHVDGETFETYVTVEKIAAEIGQANIGRVRKALQRVEEEIGLIVTVKKSTGWHASVRRLTLETGTTIVPDCVQDTGTSIVPVQTGTKSNRDNFKPGQNELETGTTIVLRTGTIDVPPSTHISIHTSTQSDCSRNLNPQLNLIPDPGDEVFMTYPTKDKKGVPGDWKLTRGKLNEYRETYPGLDVDGEARKSRQWCIDNPTKRKTSGGMPAFLNRWMISASKPVTQNRNGGQNGCFNNARGIPECLPL